MDQGERFTTKRLADARLKYARGHSDKTEEFLSNYLWTDEHKLNCLDKSMLVFIGTNCSV